MCLAAFGPYVAGPIRTEQLIIYALAPIALLLAPNLRRWNILILILWSFVIVSSLFGYVFPYMGGMPRSAGSPLAGLDNLALPLVVMFVIWTFVPPAVAISSLRMAAAVVTIASTANAVLAIATSISPSLALSLQGFWTGGDTAVSVAENSMIMGRYSGIFGQPAEAGVMYSLAVILAVWRFSRHPILMYILLSVLTVGGILTVSKIFILVGLPIVLLLLWLLNRGAARSGLVLAAVMAVSLVALSGFLQQWDGFSYFSRLFEFQEGQSAVALYTANRWDEGSFTLQTIGFVLSASPLIGMGLGGLAVPYDSQWTESIVMGGIFATTGIALTLFVLLRGMLKIADRSLRLTALAFWAVLIGGSFGLPVLTGNRIATVTWVVVALFLVVANAQQDEDAARGNHAVKWLHGSLPNRG
ncbi:hypothetical protein [Citricoccus muralis]|uniref:O-antigen ligase-like membrane protein n=1 Tax=Citricoccus muralis TaxID=169134 RepID=A0A3D9LDQ1_9MICC|nr:hypothetical protein [Citricoccus muralis]REE03776.1 hypothetical protein C8E99_1595 [Citricoccus muralis]